MYKMYKLAITAEELDKILAKQQEDLNVANEVIDNRISVAVNFTVVDGSEIKFRSPAACSAITGLSVQYPDEFGVTTTKEFAFADAHGNNVGDIDHLFAENAVVKVILDVTKAMAFVQNADTNAYLESRIDGVDLSLPQELTPEQRAQIIQNIGAINSINGITPDADGNIILEALDHDCTVPVINSQADNGISLRSLETGAYILQGNIDYGENITSTSGGTYLKLGDNPRLAYINKTSTTTALRLFGAAGADLVYKISDNADDNGNKVTVYNIDLKKQESVDNRVTAIDNTADDEHYPTAKAVADYVASSSGSGSGSVDFDTDGFEKIENRVTVVDSTADNEHYPTAKAVRDAIKAGALLSDPTTALTADMVDYFYSAAFYTSLSKAVVDLNAGTIGTNADATADNAVCALYSDYDGNTCLIILSNIDLSESLTISADVIFKVNGHTINYTGNYSIRFAGNDIIDCRVRGSKFYNNTNVETSPSLMLRLEGSVQLLGGEIERIASVADSTIVTVLIKGTVDIDNCSIYTESKGGAGKISGVQTQGNITMRNSRIDSKSADSICEAINTTASASGLYISNCELIANSSNGIAYGVAIHSTNSTIDGCFINVGSIEVGQTLRGINVGPGGGIKAVNTKIFADGLYGGTENNSQNGLGVGLLNYGTASLVNCEVYGTHSGIQCGESSTTTINGGLYESTGHGGVYLANLNGNFYAQNATFRTVPYRGTHKDRYMYTGTDYLNAAVYVSATPGIKAYMDNCILDGNGPTTIGVDSGGEEPMRAEPIRFKNGGTGNSVYASNCTFKGAGKIRFGGGSTQRLYLGFANRVLCEASIPSCVDSTTYAGTVFTSWPVQAAEE
jgi:hypothetical protein